nr:DUF1788 domain-containing protein [uncultured Tyzzerella sp.]
MSDLNKRLEDLESRMYKDEFIKGKGLSNEIRHFVFDYESEIELEMREIINQFIIKNNSINKNKIAIFDIYDIIINMLDEKGFLNKCYDFEKSKGFNIISQAINDFLRMEEDNEDNILLKYIKENVNDSNVIFLVGIGKCFPIIRAHKVLNNLHQYLDDIPAVLFYPGRYTGTSFSLFNKINDGNYYRAFKI